MDVISPSLCPKQYDMHSPFKWWRRKKRKLSCNKLPQNNLPIIRYLMVLQGPTVGEKCFDAWNLNINMMCRQYTPSLFLIRVMFQKNNFFPRKATVNAVVVYGPWTFALRVLRVPGDCPVKQSEPETVAEKGAKEKKKTGLRLSRLPSCSHVVSSQVATVQRPNQVRARQFQHMILHIVGCRRQNADPETQVGHHPLRQILSIERRASNLSVHCNTAKNKRRLRTHPCFTPEVMGQLRLALHLPRTSPDWPSYTLESIHIM